MHAVFFEVRTLPGHMPHYFEHVARLKPLLARHSGLVFMDRYAPADETERLLSHQLWDSDAAIAGWRREAEHRRSQTAGRRKHFADYRIRVGARVLHWRAGAPDGLQRAAAAADGAHVVALYGRAPVAAPGFEAFESVNHKGRFIALASADSLAAAEALLGAHLAAPGLDEAAAYSIRRDYGLHDRAQAPD